MYKFFKQYALIVFSLLSFSTAYSTSSITTVDNPPFDTGLPLIRPSTTERYQKAISWSGAAFRFPWEFGAAAFLQAKYPTQLPKVCFIGASAGAMTSTLLACDVKIARDVMGIKVKSDGVTPILKQGKFQYTNDGWIDKVYDKLSKDSTGVYFNIFEAIRDTEIEKDNSLLLDGYEERATNRATFALTKVTLSSQTKQRINQFGSKQDLIDYGFASGHLPYLVDGTPYVTVNGQNYIDGGFLDNQPIFAESNTIKLWPYMDSILSTAPLSWFSFYGTTDMDRNRGIFKDGYNFAKSEYAKSGHGIWASLNAIT